MDNRYVAVYDSELSSIMGSDRWVIKDSVTDEVIDNAQGYGYKSPQKAFAAFAYKGCEPQTFQATLARRKRIHHWLINHPEFLRDMNHTAFELAKGMYGPDEVFNASVVKELLKDHGITVDFTPMDILSVWEKGANCVE